MKKQLHLIFEKTKDEKKFTVRIDNPKENLSKLQVEDAAYSIIESGVFEDMTPISAHIIETSVEVIDLAG